MSRRLAGLLLLSLCAALGLAQAPKDTAPTIRDIMKKLNRGPGSITPTLQQDLKDDDPDWEAIQEQTAEYVKLTAALTKNKPTKGEPASWERLAQAYSAEARSLDAAAKRKNKQAASAVLKRINNSCNACHKAHKPE
jgi:cytochrome c556